MFILVYSRPLDNGQILQILKKLPGLYKLDQKQCLEVILPIVDNALAKEDIVLHNEASATFFKFLSTEKIAFDDLSTVFLPVVVKSIDAADLGKSSILYYRCVSRYSYLIQA